MSSALEPRSLSTPHYVVIALLCAGAVASEGYLLTHLFADAAPHRADAVFGVLNGTPHWRAYQNRLLGPQLVRGVQMLFGTGDVTSLAMFFWMAVAAKAFAVFLLFRHVTARPVLAAGYVVAASALTVCCLSFWVYPWDHLDAVFLSLMLMGITQSWGRGKWLVLFLFGLWNRETALLLPLWLIIDWNRPSIRWTPPTALLRIT